MQEKILQIEPEDISLLLETIKKEFAYTDFSGEKFAERILQPNVAIFKITKAKKFVGFIDIELLNAKTGRITAMSVLPEHRGKKLGKKLVDFAIDFFKKQGTQKIVLLVKQENNAAKKIYAGFGFKKTKTLKKKIDDSIIEEMELQL